MKAHIGADRDSGRVHTVVGTAANVADVAVGHALLHVREKQVVADAGYQGAAKRPEAKGKAQWHVAMKAAERKHWKTVPRIGATQVQRVGLGVLSVKSRCLQSRQVQLQAIVCDQRGLDSGGEQQGARAHRGDSVRLLHRSPFLLAKISASLTRVHDGFAANGERGRVA